MNEHNSEWRVWLTAVLLGGFIGLARQLAQWNATIPWVRRIGAWMLNVSATVLCGLYLYDTYYQQRPTVWLFYSAAAGLLGHEIPELADQLLQRWKRTSRDPSVGPPSR